MKQGVPRLPSYSKKGGFMGSAVAVCKISRKKSLTSVFRSTLGALAVIELIGLVFTPSAHADCPDDWDCVLRDIQLASKIESTPKCGNKNERFNNVQTGERPDLKQCDKRFLLYYAAKGKCKDEIPQKNDNTERNFYVCSALSKAFANECKLCACIKTPEIVDFLTTKSKIVKDEYSKIVGVCNGMDFRFQKNGEFSCDLGAVSNTPCLSKSNLDQEFSTVTGLMDSLPPGSEKDRTATVLRQLQKYLDANCEENPFHDDEKTPTYTSCLSRKLTQLNDLNLGEDRTAQLFNSAQPYSCAAVLLLSKQLLAEQVKGIIKDRNPFEKKITEQQLSPFQRLELGELLFGFRGTHREDFEKLEKQFKNLAKFARKKQLKKPNSSEEIITDFLLHNVMFLEENELIEAKKTLFEIKEKRKKTEN